MANLDDCPTVDGATPPPRARKRRGDRDQRRPSSWRGEAGIRPCPLSPATSAGGCHYRAWRTDGRGAASTQKGAAIISNIIITIIVINRTFTIIITITVSNRNIIIIISIIIIAIIGVS